MKIGNILSGVALLVLNIFSCSLNRVEVVKFTPSGEVDKMTSFTIEFSKPLASREVLGKWHEAEYIEFEPVLKGKYKWLDNSTLIFSPDYALEPMQSYTARITDKVLFKTDYSADFKTIEFHTAYFDVKKIDFFWSYIPETEYKVSVRANIHFTYPVSADKLNQYMIVERNGEQLKNLEIVSNVASELLVVNIGGISQTDKEQNFRVIFKKGLMSVMGKKPLEEKRIFNYVLRPVTSLSITEVTSGFDGMKGWIEVGTTQRVDEKSLKDYVELEPQKQLQFYVNDNSFRIEADFKDIPAINLRIRKGLQGVFSGSLEEDFEQTVYMVELEPQINFTDRRGKYLMIGGERNLEVNAVNIDEVEIELSQVFKNNVLFFLDRYEYSYDDNYEDDYYYNPSYYVDNYGRQLYTYNLELNNKRNWLEKFTINLDSLKKLKQKGIFVINVMSAEDRWISDSKMLGLTDIGIITKKSEKDMMVFVNSIATTDPLPNVEVNIISTTNQLLMTGRTDKFGVAIFRNIIDRMSGFIPRLITCETDDDFNYMDLKETLIETSRFDVGGLKEVSTEYRTFVYSDRDIYRPGENVYMSAIIRDEGMKRTEAFPIIVKVISPTGKTFGEYKRELNEEGSFELVINTPQYAETGEYQAFIYSGINKLIGSYKFNVEEFVPDKIRVLVKGSKDKAFKGDEIKLDIDAEFLFGAKAGGLKYEVNIYYRHKPYYSHHFKNYDFNSTSTKNEYIANEAMDGYLDENGSAVIMHKIPDNLNSSGIVECAYYVSVYDLTGRTVNRFFGVDVFPKDYFIGILSSGYYFGLNKQLNFKIAVSDRDDNQVKDFPVHVALVRYQWQTVLKKDYYDKFYYASEQTEIVEWERDFTINSSPYDLKFFVQKSGKYELRISKKDSPEYVRSEFYAYGWTSTMSASFEVDKEGRIDIMPDKKLYQPGEKAKVLFTTPFSGKMLVTIERNGVYDYQYVDLKNKSAEIKLDIKDEYMPNVYITATIFKKHNPDRTTPFFVGHGFQSIKVEKKINKLPVTINAPLQVKPNTKQTITIKTLPEKNIYVTLAAVDEGILQVRGFKTPDPYNYMYAKRSLRIETYDLYRLLLPEIVASSSGPGGGDEEAAFESERRKRTNPITTQRFKLLAYWSGILKTNGSGIVSVPLSIPQFNGEVRLMAVAYSDSRFGSGEKAMKISDDLIIEAQIPRFLSSGDMFFAPVTVINTTKKGGDVEVRIGASGPIYISSSDKKNVSIQPNSTATVEFNIKAKNESGIAGIKIEASGMGKVVENFELPVRPASPLISESGSGSIKGGGNVSFKVPQYFLKGTQNTSLTISRFPAVKFGKQLKYLLGYPFGCIEQTVSKLLPQLYFADLSKALEPKMFSNQNPSYFVREGIRKLESMQMYDGSMEYWKGCGYTNWWGSVYAAHFLVEARKAGFDVSDNVIKKLLRFISKQVASNKTYDYVYYSNNQRRVTRIANKENIYSLYVLALAGKGDISMMNYYKSRPHLLSRDEKYLLAGAYAHMGKWSYYYSTIPKDFQIERAERTSGGCFDSEIRANAIMLNVLLESEPLSKHIPSLIKYLSGKIKDAYSTQETAFALLALGKSAKARLKDKISIEVYLDNKLYKTFTGTDVTLSDNKLSYSQISLKARGKGEAYYFWSTEGVRTDDRIQEYDSYLKIRRQYSDFRTKRAISNYTFEQGQLVLCKIILTGGGRTIENISIADLVPSGFEIENPRFSILSQMTDKKGNGFIPDYLDVRDDRLLLFTNAVSGTVKEFTYLLRVVNQGEFTLAPIYADAMYDPDYRSINGTARVKVISQKYAANLQ